MRMHAPASGRLLACSASSRGRHRTWTSSLRDRGPRSRPCPRRSDQRGAT
ncbi:hypothetical protein ACFPRL_15160 [Pseudoclavibacter helvolus]